MADNQRADNPLPLTTSPKAAALGHRSRRFRRVPFLSDAKRTRKACWKPRRWWDCRHAALFGDSRQANGRNATGKHSGVDFSEKRVCLEAAGFIPAWEFNH